MVNNDTLCQMQKMWIATLKMQDLVTGIILVILQCGKFTPEAHQALRPDPMEITPQVRSKFDTYVSFLKDNDNYYYQFVKLKDPVPVNREMKLLIRIEALRIFEMQILKYFRELHRLITSFPRRQKESFNKVVVSTTNTYIRV